MPSSQGNEKGLNLSRQESFNLLYMLAKAHAMCFLPIFRRNFGSEALGWNGLTAFILMMVVGSFGRIPGMMGFMGIWLVVMLCQRVSTMRQLSRGVIRHSRYEGDPKARFFRNRSTVRYVLEPLTCVIYGVGIELTGASHGLAMFVGLGAVSLSLVALIDRQLVNKRVQAMRDSAIEQSYFAAKCRGEIEDD